MAAPGYVYYGDDYTGASDTLATLAVAGRRTMLFTGVPTAVQLDAAGPLDAIGIAGAARSMAPQAMRIELAEVGRFFASTGASILHYKVCSTFDSAPHVGNIATAVETLRPHVRQPVAAIVGGQPNLGRYCVFGHLFAAAQTGGAVVRLDRHPTMRCHPVTPMHESDLRVHLAALGLERIELVPYPTYESPPAAQAALWGGLIATSPAAVLFDVARAADLVDVGRLLHGMARDGSLLVVGASSVAQAWLGDAASTGTHPRVAAASGTVLVMAGSLSPMTARQVDAATSYEHVAIDVAALLRDDSVAIRASVDRVAEALRSGRHVLAHTGGRGGVDAPPSATLAAACGRWLDAVLRACPVRRVGVAGGDTSSHALKSLDVWGLSYLGALAPGVALCRASSAAPHLDGIELMLKGGQMGAPDLFERLIAP